MREHQLARKRSLTVGSIVALAVATVIGSGVLASASQTVAAPTASLVVTQADNGTTIELREGDRFLLQLGADLNWTVTVTDDSVVSLVPGVLVIRGAQGIFEAESPGETDLNATGVPNCVPSQACPQFVAVFRVHIKVRTALRYRVVVPLLAAAGMAAQGFTVSGTVLAGPTCPVERIPPDPRCADRPVGGAEIIVVNEAGALVSDIVSDATGSFSIALPSGTYTIEPQVVQGLLGTAPPQTISITDAGVVVTVLYDTGIR